MLELVANCVATLSIWLAVRNNVHTWTTGIVGCFLFLIVFFQNQLYADATLQVFFIITSIIGCWQWKQSKLGRPSISKTDGYTLGMIAIVAITVTIGYGWLLLKYTKDFMPFIDALVLTLSIAAQCLLMQRKIESWPVWILVNTASIALYVSRGMNITAILYFGYWLNAWYGWYRWRSLSVSGVPA